MTFYLVSAVIVFVFSGLLAMAGLGAAFLFVPLFYYMGVPLAEATATALLLNTVSLLFATVNYWRGHLINWRVGLPVLITAVILSPLGARLTPYVNKTLLLGLFAAFLVFAGAMMLFYR
ncbi:MAG: sulfite exporter TauE/SafE family protein, partial [Anaerolineae bacterium]|nr:sulfite exporter TauE/SafE family protein [Anaerolineae bacterium]